MVMSLLQVLTHAVAAGLTTAALLQLGSPCCSQTGVQKSLFQNTLKHNRLYVYASD